MSVEDVNAITWSIVGAVITVIFCFFMIKDLFD